LIRAAQCADYLSGRAALYFDAVSAKEMAVASC